MSKVRRLIILCFFLSFTSSSFATTNYEAFVPSEHVIMGNRIKLYFTANDLGQTDYTFQLPNGLTVTYGDMIALGDFYEIVNQPIVYGKTASERKARFVTAFNSLAQAPEAVSEAEQILAVIHDEKSKVEDALSKGENPENIYKNASAENNRKYNCITGGGCASSTWWTQPGKYLKLTYSNYSHFGSNAWLTYKTGHDVAIEQAIIAYQTHDLKKLELAYAMNAFACHFLSDSFAAGHIRTPREELPASVTPSDIGSALSSFMHTEENVNSLHVHNLRGDHWVAYGDGYYFNQKNDMQRAMINEALQLSVNQIFSAYQHGVTEEHDAVYELIPIADEVKNASRQDISPLFYWDDQTKTLMRRQDTANLYDRHWTADWWGWSTLALLAKQRGLPLVVQEEIALSGNGEQAMEYGLITDKDVVDYIKANSRHRVLS